MTGIFFPLIMIALSLLLESGARVKGLVARRA
jgi:hypothetical protein